uniref:Uncharacterized protein n=2 Tax=Anguilla anguilla TaxID=7936 RepID=A0A0E9VDN5_ANGAN
MGCGPRRMQIGLRVLRSNPSGKKLLCEFENICRATSHNRFQTAGPIHKPEQCLSRMRHQAAPFVRF